MLSVCLRFQVLFPHMLSDCYFCCEPPGGSDGKKKKKIHLQCRKHRLDPWVGKIPWRRKWQPTPVFLSGKFHGQRSLEGYSPWCCKELDTTERLHFVANKEINSLLSLIPSFSNICYLYLWVLILQICLFSL